MARKPTNGSTPIDTVRHQDKRVNIPTEELRDFVADDEKNPRTMLYPRDPSLDPQLVWKGKDEQDRADLAVPAVPIYIQEKIHPQAIIEDVRTQAKKDAPEAQMGLFGDFNGITFEDLIDFYHHEQKWANRMILGDSLLVMTSLAEKEGLKGKVQMIYLDPPYGIKFGSNWQVSTRKRDVKDGKHEDVTHQPEQIRAFRDTWKLGIHSYLAYLRDRLVMARELLTETGSVFVQIGDENVHLVRCLLDEVFGGENFCSIITIAKTSGSSADKLPAIADFLLWYAKDVANCKYRSLFFEKVDGEGADEYKYLILPDGSRRSMAAREISDPATLPPDSIRYRPSALTSQRPAQGLDLREFEYEGKKFSPGKGTFKTDLKGLSILAKAGRLIPRLDSISYERRLNDFPVVPVSNVWMDARWGFDASEKRYVVETNHRIVARCLLMTTDPGDLVLDPTCGSGTTAYVAEQWGRRWITCDTSRVALALARTRLMSAKFPYYFLADSPEGVKKEAEVAGKLPPDYRTDGDIRKGFVYKRVPHITLKAIANNSEIDTIHARWQEKIGPVLEKLSSYISPSPGLRPPSPAGRGAGCEGLQEWQIPREADAKWPAPAKKLHEEFWQLRRDRQKEIDASIARNADTEVLYDQPYEDNKRIRVTGPFTVESLSPHRVLSTDEERPAAERDAQREATSGQFETMILDNLKKAGVQNTRKNERLKFDRLETYAGEWLHAAGDYTDSDGIPRKVAVCLGPEHGTVGPELIKEAAKEALKGVGFDLLIVCGFAFDAHAGETAKEFTPHPHPDPPLEREGGNCAPIVAENYRQFGKLPVLLARMNPDLSMGEELLKNTGTGNLFMVFGEPDVTIHRLPSPSGRGAGGEGGKVQVDIKGVDVYDPTTGVIRSSSTDEIACWFIDTDYNGESFFVRHAYFTGANEPYDKLKRALRAEIDEAAWSALYSTTSRPFDIPSKGKIAVKVINHYGDEVLKVFEVK